MGDSERRGGQEQEPKVSKTMNRRNYRAARRGFSLLELMLVLAIIGVLTAVAAVSLSGSGERAKRKATIASMAQIANALKLYKLDHNVYPATLTALQAGSTAYLDADNSCQVGWKQDFWDAGSGVGGRDFDLYSRGSTGTFASGGGDDLDYCKVKDEGCAPRLPSPACVAA